MDNKQHIKKASNDNQAPFLMSLQTPTMKLQSIKKNDTEQTKNPLRRKDFGKQKGLGISKTLSNQNTLEIKGNSSQLKGLKNFSQSKLCQLQTKEPLRFYVSNNKKQNMQKKLTTTLPIQNFDVPNFDIQSQNPSYRPFSEDNVTSKKFNDKLGDLQQTNTNSSGNGNNSKNRMCKRNIQQQKQQTQQQMIDSIQKENQQIQQIIKQGKMNQSDNINEQINSNTNINSNSINSKQNNNSNKGILEREKQISLKESYQLDNKYENKLNNNQNKLKQHLTKKLSHDINLNYNFNSNNTNNNNTNRKQELEKLDIKNSNNNIIGNKNSYVSKFRNIFGDFPDNNNKKYRKFESPAVFQNTKSFKKLNIINDKTNDIFPDFHNVQQQISIIESECSTIKEDTQINNKNNQSILSNNRFGYMKAASSHSQLSSSNSNDKETKINFITHKKDKNNKNTSIILSSEIQTPKLQDTITVTSIINNSSSMSNKSAVFHTSKNSNTNNSNSFNNSAIFQPPSQQQAQQTQQSSDIQKNIPQQQSLFKQKSKDDNKENNNSSSSNNNSKSKNNNNIQKTYIISECNDEVDTPSDEIKGKLIQWKMGYFIGSGTFGQVFRALNINTGQLLAVKKIPMIGECDKSFVESTEDELKLMQNVNHNNVIKYFGHEKIDNSLCIYLEYMDAGNIQTIYKKFGALEEQNIRLYTKQILQGLQYLHSKGIIHRDIKGANILVDNEGTVKLSDFGCAKQLELTLNSLSERKDINNTLKGSVPWMAPEVIKQTKYTYKSDIWSFGCTILEMATGKLPWMQHSFDNPIQAIVKIGCESEVPMIPDFVSPNVRDFLQLCIQRNPDDRLSAEELLKHEFLQV